MKKTLLSVLSAIMAAVMLLSCCSFGAFAEDAAPAEEAASQSAAENEEILNGIVSDKNGEKFYENGKPVKNRVVKIDKARYLFGSDGYMVKGKNVKLGKKKYYLADNGKVRAWSKGKKYYRNNGKKMTKAQKEDFKTRITAEKIASKITKKSMTKAEKLRACFNWVMAKPYVTYRKFYPTKYWPATYANDHFKRRGGDCHADGAAFAYLAVAIGYKNVYVCNDSNGLKAQGHCWTEINGKVYDPLFAQAKSFSKNYGVSYGTYKLSPILHIKMDYNSKRPAK